MFKLFRLQNNQNVTDIDNENMQAYELGCHYFNESTSWYLAAYSMSKRDVIFQDSNRQNVTGAETSHNGVEFDVKHVMNDQFRLTAQLSYANHKYENSNLVIAENIVGNKIDTAPEWMSRVNLVYRANEALEGMLSVNYLSEQKKLTPIKPIIIVLDR